MKHLTTVLALAAALSVSAQTAGRRELMTYDGTDAHNIVYRIPAIATVGAGEHKGRLIAIGDYRHCGGDIGAGRIDLHICTSDDNGDTWTAPADLKGADGEPVARGTGLGTLETSLQHPDCGFGDAALVADMDSPEVLLMSVCGRTNLFRARRDNPNQVARWYSADGGTTWSKYENITEPIYSLFDGTIPAGFIDSMFFGSGKIAQSRKIKKGKYRRLYAVLSGWNATTRVMANWVLYSDDFGRTWAILGDPANPPVPVSGDEPKAEELPDGSVVLSARPQGKLGRHFNIYRYDNPKKATGSWGELALTAIDGVMTTPCDGEILMVPAVRQADGAKCTLMLQSVPFSNVRERVGIAYKALTKPDDWATPEKLGSDWEGHVEVTQLPSAYSTMSMQKDGRVAFFYEETTTPGHDYTMVYLPIDIEELTGGNYRTDKKRL